LNITIEIPQPTLTAEDAEDAEVRGGKAKTVIKLISSAFPGVLSVLCGERLVRERDHGE
jgi:hypothetical protein